MYLLIEKRFEVNGFCSSFHLRNGMYLWVRKHISEWSQTWMWFWIVRVYFSSETSLLKRLFIRDVEAKGLIDLLEHFHQYVSQWIHYFIRPIIIWFYWHNCIVLMLSSVIDKKLFVIEKKIIPLHAQPLCC